MKTSVLIIAHNEESHIGACIESVIAQTMPADEIVVVAHNCTDATERIAQSYPVKLVSFDGPSGITHARIESLKHVTGDVVLCTDGDAIVAPNWIAVMVKVLAGGKHVLVGSHVIFTGTAYNRLCNVLNTMTGWFAPRQGKGVAGLIWGPSMAFWAKDKDIVSEIFSDTYQLSHRIGLSRNPDDYWLALYMGERGSLGYTTQTTVCAVAKETTSIDAYRRNRENNRNARLMRAYFNGLSL